MATFAREDKTLERDSRTSQMEDAVSAEGWRGISSGGGDVRRVGAPSGLMERLPWVSSLHGEATAATSTTSSLWTWRQCRIYRPSTEPDGSDRPTACVMSSSFTMTPLPVLADIGADCIDVIGVASMGVKIFLDESPHHRPLHAGCHSVLRADASSRPLAP